MRSPETAVNVEVTMSAHSGERASLPSTARYMLGTSMSLASVHACNVCYQEVPVTRNIWFTRERRRKQFVCSVPCASRQPENAFQMPTIDDMARGRWLYYAAPDVPHAHYMFRAAQECQALQAVGE